MNHEDWRDLLRHAYQLSKASLDPSTQNGAVLVNEQGRLMGGDHNRFPEGVNTNHPSRWERPLKYKFIEHAERNVIYMSARRGVKTEGLTMVCPWAACAECARAIIQAGINQLVTHKQAHDRTPDRWKKEIDVAFEMLGEAGVKVIVYDGEIDGVHDVLHTGEYWSP